MSFSRHPETYRLTERVNNTFHQLLRCFYCYDGSDWTTLLPQVEFAYNAFHALGTEHTPFEANFGFSPEEPPDLLFSMRPSIIVSHDASERLQLLHEIHTMVRCVLQLHKDEMHARTEPSTTPHFARGGKVLVVTANLFLRGQPNMKLRDRQLGPFTVKEQNEKHSYRLKLPKTIRLHHVFHVNNLRPCSTAPLRQAVPVTVPKGDDEEFDVSHISAMCVKSLPRRRGKYLLFMTHFRDDDIPPV
jgi:putative transposase